MAYTLNSKFKHIYISMIKQHPYKNKINTTVINYREAYVTYKVREVFGRKYN